MRHAWQLQAKQSVTYMGLGEEPPPGCVEPNLAFSERLDGLVGKTIDVLGGIEGIDIERLQRFRRLVGQVRAIAEKQLAGKPLLGNDRRVLDRYGPTLGELSYFEGNAWLADERMPWMSLVADVHTEHLAAKTLEVATGGAMPIYVVVPAGGKQHLMVGGVYSYYEFRQPIAGRLTDAAWRKRCERGEVPPLPGWTGSFVPGRDVEALLAKLRDGQQVAELRYVRDPRIAGILKRELAPGGRFAKGERRAWAIGLYGLKAGCEAMPFLLSLLDAQAAEDSWSARETLRVLLEPGDVPMLKRLTLESGERKARACLRLLGGLQAQDAIVEVFERTQDRRVKSSAVDLLGWQGSRDATPALVAAYRDGELWLRESILRALARIWETPPRRDGLRPRPQSKLSVEQEAALRKQVSAVALEALTSPSDSLRRNAIKAAAALQLQQAIPDLERLAARRYMAGSVLRALHALGSAEADAALVRLLDREYADAQVYGDLIPAIASRRAAAAVPALTRLLGDTRETRVSDNRVCDWAVYALARLDADGPGFWRPPERNPAARDALLEAWQLHLAAKAQGGVAKAEPAAAAALADKLLGLTDAREASRGSWDPSQSIHWVLLAQRCMARAPEARRDALTQQIDRLLVQLARKEVKRIADVLGHYKRAFGELPPDEQGHWERVITERRYASLDPSRLDKQGRLCDPWGRPYRYHRPARHMQAPMELYSVGPNAKDEGGQGDDIANWQVE